MNSEVAVTKEMAERIEKTMLEFAKRVDAELEYGKAMDTIIDEAIMKRGGEAYKQRHAITEDIPIHGSFLTLTTPIGTNNFFNKFLAKAKIDAVKKKARKAQRKARRINRKNK